MFNVAWSALDNISSGEYTYIRASLAWPDSWTDHTNTWSNPKVWPHLDSVCIASYIGQLIYQFTYTRNEVEEANKAVAKYQKRVHHEESKFLKPLFMGVARLTHLIVYPSQHP